MLNVNIVNNVNNEHLHLIKFESGHHHKHDYTAHQLLGSQA